MSISIYTGLIVPIVFNSLHFEYNSATLLKMSMMTMCGLGLGEIVGGILMGIIVDKIGAKKSSLINSILILIQTILVCAYIEIDNYSFLAYVMTFAWGVQDSSVSIHLDAILGFEFESNKEPFAIGKIRSVYRFRCDA